MNEKQKNRRIEEILLHHLMTLSLPIERWQENGGTIIIEWMVDNQIKQARYQI